MKMQKAAALCLMLAGIAAAAAGCGQNKADNRSFSVPENVTELDCSAKSAEYLNYIGTNLRNRDITPVGKTVSADNRHDAAREWIVSELEKAGYSADSIRQVKFTAKGDEGKKYSGTNIVLSLRGKDTSKQIIIGAHYDGDGCGDNGSGIALLLAEAAALQGRTPARDTEIVFFDGEEVGELGSSACAKKMSSSDIEKTEYMVNIDSIAFGDYCDLYGGIQDDSAKKVESTGAYRLAMKTAARLGFRTYGTKELNGFYKKHGAGPSIEDDAVYTNPWTYENPAPSNAQYMSPSTGDWGDHAPFSELGIQYIYMEATNWYAKGTESDMSYTGYYETADTTKGDGGMFMNTKYDTLENLNAYYPGRAQKHFRIFSMILSSLILD